MNIQTRAILAVVLFAADFVGAPTQGFAHHNAVEMSQRPSILLIKELPPTSRGCIPGPHEIGRVRRLPGVAMTSASPWAFNPNVDAYPHCRYDSQEEADRAARRGY